MSHQSTAKQLDTLHTNNTTDERLLPCILIDTARHFKPCSYLSISQTVAVPWSYNHVEGALKRAVHKTKCMKGSHWKPLADKVFLKLQFPFATGASCIPALGLWGGFYCTWLFSKTFNTPLHSDIMEQWKRAPTQDNEYVNTHSHTNFWWNTLHCIQNLRLNVYCTVIQRLSYINTRSKQS